MSVKTEMAGRIPATQLNEVKHNKNSIAWPGQVRELSPETVKSLDRLLPIRDQRNTAAIISAIFNSARLGVRSGAAFFILALLSRCEDDQDGIQTKCKVVLEELAADGKISVDAVRKIRDRLRKKQDENGIKLVTWDPPAKYRNHKGELRSETTEYNLSPFISLIIDVQREAYCPPYEGLAEKNFHLAVNYAAAKLVRARITAKPTSTAVQRSPESDLKQSMTYLTKALSDLPAVIASERLFHLLQSEEFENRREIIVATLKDFAENYENLREQSEANQKMAASIQEEFCPGSPKTGGASNL